MAEEERELTLEEKAAQEAYDIALEVYTKHTGGRVLRRPRPAFLSREMVNAIVRKVVPFVEAELVEALPVVQSPDAVNAEVDRAEDEAYARGLRHACHLVESLEGRPGKKQIAEMLRAELRKAEKEA
jgi:hypothetical protein